LWTILAFLSKLVGKGRNLMLKHDKFGQSLSRLDEVRIGRIHTNQFPTGGVAPTLQHSAPDCARQGIRAIGVQILVQEHPDLIDERVTLAVSVNNLTRYNRGLVIEHEPHDLDVEIHGLRHRRQL
jgi:hypothetical protein